MKNKLIIAGVATFIFWCIERRIMMTKVKVPMTQMETDELVRRVKAMSHEELEIVVCNIPVEFCMKRIEMELGKAKMFEKKIKEAAEVL